MTDNDREQSAKDVVKNNAGKGSVQITYDHEPQQNIALARNRALANATGEFIAFIDDDELPVREWLARLFKCCSDTRADGVLGPVLPKFEKEPPRWVTRGRFFDRPTHETGFVIDWTEGRTGNLLLRRRILEGMKEVFRRQFGGGGEDRDFFMRMSERKHVFVWCNEAEVYETVPANRWKRSFMLRRALLRGKMSLNYATFSGREIGKSIVAVSLYTIMLPFLLLAGQHLFMKYLIRLFDHGGKLLTFAGFSAVSQSYVTE